MTVVVAFDPFGGWVEACASLGLDGVFYISDLPGPNMTDAVHQIRHSAAPKLHIENKKRETA